METKKFISALGLSKEMTQFVSKENIVDFTVMNVEREKKTGIVNFQTISDYHRIENHSLDTNGQNAFELFGQFRTSKNAIACILKAMETKGEITDETFENQSKITPAGYTDEIKKLKSFGDFWGHLKPAEQKQFADIAGAWMKEVGFLQSSFDFYHINGENGLQLAQGDYVKIYDPIYGQEIYSRVFQASPKGLVTLIDDNATFTLSAESAKKTNIIALADVPEKVLEFFTKTYDAYTEECEERKTKKLEIAIKANDKAQEMTKKADEKAEKLATSAKAKEAKAILSAQELADLEALPVNTQAEVETVVALIGTKEEILLPAHKRAMEEKVKLAKNALKAQAKDLKANGTKKPELATAEIAPATTARAKRQPKPEATPAEAPIQA